MSGPAPEVPGEAAPADAMHCGGCGAKVASPVLSAALARIDPGMRRDVIVGLDTPDDAAILETPPGTLLVQSVDHFRPFVDDPYVFGHVTAVHCLSDLFAMGAQAHSAQAMVTLAYARADKQEEELFQLLSGATEALREAGAALVGGHTGEGPEASFGLAVNGFAASGAVLRKGGARPGDRLVLTKALGTGVILAADMRARAGAGTLQGALASMRLSNRIGAEVLAAHGASGCTDISGFGLLGHLVEVLEASGVRARIETALIPLLPGAEELLERGFRSTLHPGNEAFRARLGWRGACQDSSSRPPRSSDFRRTARERPRGVRGRMRSRAAGGGLRGRDNDRRGAAERWRTSRRARLRERTTHEDGTRRGSGARTEGGNTPPAARDRWRERRSRCGAPVRNASPAGTRRAEARPPRNGRAFRKTERRPPESTNSPLPSHRA